MLGRLRFRSYFHKIRQFPLIVRLFKHGYITETFFFCRKYAFCGKTFREICNATCHSLYSNRYQFLRRVSCWIFITGYRDTGNSIKTLFFSDKLQEFTDKEYERKCNENTYPIKVQTQSEGSYYLSKCVMF